MKDIKAKYPCFMWTVLLMSILTNILCGQTASAGLSLREEAVGALYKAGGYYRWQVAVHGGYVYYYSPDLKQRLGEGVATDSQIWVQPPGTPTVGMAFIEAYEATGDRFFLEAAQEAAEALIYGQLESGGWTNSIDFDPKGQVAQYRNGRGRGKNNSSLDDGQSSSAIRLIIQVDQALDFNNTSIHQSAQAALDALLAAQYPNGGFPQVWTGPVKPQPVMKASYPDYDWRTEGRIKEYWNLYTLNDNVCGYVAETLIDAVNIYRQGRYQTALKRLGDFFLLAQMPEPQPGWAQQYNYQMKPIWARAFEPPAVASDETQETLETLLTIYRVTGDTRYLEPFERALSYLKRSVLPEGKLARYYELKTNRPLYMVRDGKSHSLTYDDSKLPSHYGWKIDSRIDEIEKSYQALKQNRNAILNKSLTNSQDHSIRAIINQLDSQGRWISTYQGEPLIGQPKFKPGEAYVASEVFSKNMEMLSHFISDN